ncbi:flagellar motor protein MotA, partial [Photobacterium sp. OFAV2-7]|nr:flagellar motor protein MotA [Photobacterium sp. OFAV2-7]
MKIKALATALCLFTLPFTASATDSLVEKTQQAQKVQATHNAEREAGFKLTEKQVKAKLAALKAQRSQLQKETELLSETFSNNENKLAQLEEQLRLETGSLGELFGVVRQAAKDLDAEMAFSVTSADRKGYHSVVEQIVDAKALPSMSQLNGLWLGMTDQITASSELRDVSVPYINGEGYQSDTQAYRLGSIGLIGEQGYLAWDGKRQVAKPYLKQPEGGPAYASLNSLVQSGLQTAVVDPSRGIMLEQLANSPELKDRLEHGGVVGKIILGLLAVGVIIA